jgi:hypothetical protein
MQRKLLLATASVLALGYASAALAGGSSSYTLQTGDNQSINVDQSLGNNNLVGTSATPFLQQNGDPSSALAGTGGNFITINQAGDGNQVVGINGYIHPAPALGAAGQSGTSNAARVQQDGTSGIVQLQQNGHYNGRAFGYGGSINQSSTTYGSQAVVQEVGDYNDFAITQSGSSNPSAGHNRAQLTQGSYVHPASHNLARIDQESGPGAGQRLTSGQDGNYNNLHSIQIGLSTSNWLTSSQTGTGVNFWQQNQIWNYQTGSNEQANLTQNGYSLTIYNVQQGSNDNLNVTKQTGNDNTISNYQGAASSSNLVQVELQGGSYNNISSNQTGSGNVLDVQNQAGYGNWTVNWQSGSGNVATVTQQTGVGGLIDNKQSGSNGSAIYDQQGNFNKAILQDQVGTYGQLSITQEGSAFNSVVVAYQNSNASSVTENKITATQSGGHGNSAYLLQGAEFRNDASPLGGAMFIRTSAGTPGFGNSIGVIQDGSMNYAAVSQNGNANTSSTTQSGNGNHATIKQ